MPRYFFKLDNEVSLGDPDGTELPNLEAARELAGELAQDIAAREDLFDTWSLCVTNERKRPLVTIAFPSLRRK